MGSDCWNQRESPASDPGVRDSVQDTGVFKWEKDGLFNKDYDNCLSIKTRALYLTDSTKSNSRGEKTKN